MTPNEQREMLKITILIRKAEELDKALSQQMSCLLVLMIAAALVAICTIVLE